eukprot:5560003-Pleurochrysis_carterae.AAC.1
MEVSSATCSTDHMGSETTGRVKRKSSSHRGCPQRNVAGGAKAVSHLAQAIAHARLLRLGAAAVQMQHLQLRLRAQKP